MPRLYAVNGFCIRCSAPYCFYSSLLTLLRVAKGLFIAPYPNASSISIHQPSPTGIGLPTSSPGVVYVPGSTRIMPPPVVGGVVGFVLGTNKDDVPLIIVPAELYPPEA